MFNFDCEQIETIKARIDFLKSLYLLKDSGFKVPSGYILGDIESYMYEEGMRKYAIKDYLKSIFKDGKIEILYIDSEEANSDCNRYGYDVYSRFVEDGGDLDFYRLDITSPLINEYLNIIKENNVKAYNSELSNCLSDITSENDYSIIVFSDVAIDYSCIYMCIQDSDYRFVDMCKALINAEKVIRETVSNYRKHKKTKWFSRRYVLVKKGYRRKEVIKKNIIKNRNKYINVKKKEKFNRKRMLRRLS